MDQAKEKAPGANEVAQETTMQIGDDGRYGVAAVWAADGKGGDIRAGMLSGIFFITLTYKLI